MACLEIELYILYLMWPLPVIYEHNKVQCNRLRLECLVMPSSEPRTGSVLQVTTIPFTY